MATDNHYTKRPRTPDFHSLINRSEKPTFNGQGTAVSTTQYSVTAGRPLLASQPGQVDWTEDTDGNRTTYAYHPDTGRRTAVTNPLNKTEYTSYTPRGQVHRKWGDTPYPVQYLYDEHNRMVELHTFRGGTGWDGAVWPADPGTPDITTWVYDDHTGLLAQKLYDDGHGPAYTYSDAGRLETRTWARTDDQGTPLVTTYTYHPDTGELTQTDYSDSTPDITTTYTHLGQKKTVTDAIGTRTFAYSTTTFQPETETLDVCLAHLYAC